LWLVFIGILALSVLADIFVDHYGHFASEGTVGFFAWFGFLSCVILVFAAKALGVFLKRKDTYYDS